MTILIEQPGTYLARNGATIVITAINPLTKFGCVGYLVKHTVKGEQRHDGQWTNEGRFLNHAECIYDIVERVGA